MLLPHSFRPFQPRENLIEQSKKGFAPSKKTSESMRTQKAASGNPKAALLFQILAYNL